MQATPEASGMIGLGAVFTFLIVTLGPIKILGPFAQLTHDAEPAAVRRIAVRAFFFSVAAVLISAFAGVSMLEKWHVTIPALELAGGLIFLIVGLRIVLEQYQAVHAPPPALPESDTAAALRLTFPTIVTPYGIAAVMVLLAKSPNASRTLTVVAILAAVMVLNLGAMLAAHSIMRGGTILVLRIVGAVLGVLQVALAIEMLMRGFTGLGVLHG